MNVDGLLSRTVFSNTPDGFSYQHCILPNLYIICNLHLIFYSVNAKLYMYSTCICCWCILFPFFFCLLRWSQRPGDVCATVSRQSYHWSKVSPSNIIEFISFLLGILQGCYNANLILNPPRYTELCQQ